MIYNTENLKKFPTLPGVYLMKSATGAVIYIGKAKNLKQRIRQYFVPGGDGREIIPFLISKVADIETIIVSSEKEALLLENNLIKQHQPKYNALLKDDKSYTALKIGKEEWPKLTIVRYRGKPKADGTYFGPYTSATGARQTFDLLNRLFPLRQCSDQEFAKRTRPCILYDMKRCLAPCVGRCTKEEYSALIASTAQFLKGNDKGILQDLYRKMERCAEQLEFEQADEILKKIRLIEKTLEKQHVDSPLGGDTDVLGLFREAEEVTLSQMFYRGGRLTGVQTYHFSSLAQDDEELLESFILQHYGEKEELPHEILIPREVQAAETLSAILSSGRARKATVFCPQKGSKCKLIEMALANAEAAYKKEKDADTIREKTLSEAQEKLKLQNFPRRIECFDNSNLSGDSPVSTLVCFLDGKRFPSAYRKYKITTAGPSDDYGAMKEVLSRRFKRGNEEKDLPDLVIIDGGKGHLNIALKVLEELNIISVDVIGIAKEEGRHDKGMTAEQVFLPGIKDPIHFRSTSPVLFLLQQIRDEAHRTAITFQRNRRSKTLISSVLDNIPGIGAAKKKVLLRSFGSVKRIQEASQEELKAVKGISASNAEEIFRYFQGKKEK